MLEVYIINPLQIFAGTLRTVCHNIRFYYLISIIVTLCTYIKSSYLFWGHMKISRHNATTML